MHKRSYKSVKARKTQIRFSVTFMLPVDFITGNGIDQIKKQIEEALSSNIGEGAELMKVENDFFSG